MKIILLGAGLVGGAMAVDLSKDKKFDVTAADINGTNLEKLKGFFVNGIKADLSNLQNVKDLVKDYDLVLNAVPGFLGFDTLKTVIEAGKNAVDIAFYAEDPFLLDKAAKDKNVTVIVDCGVSPGLSNMLIGYADSKLDKTESVIIYAGGLPRKKEGLFEYKCVFSITDVIEEYIRPVRYVENGKQVVKPALSECELIDFPGVGTLEAFNSDGLRTIATTINAIDMKEKTLRYPGHVDKMKILREAGFFSKDQIDLGDKKVIPFNLSAKLLAKAFEFKEGDEDLTVLKVIVEGSKNGKKVRYVFGLLDTYDKKNKTHSMARTTGYMATMSIRMLADGLYKEKGISPPEFIGKNEDCFKYILKGLEERGINIKESLRESD